MDGDRTPFVTGSFDLVINNQVLEHVTDLDVVVHEIARVLKPGGSCLSLFPDKGVWREGHWRHSVPALVSKENHAPHLLRPRPPIARAWLQQGIKDTDPMVS